MRLKKSLSDISMDQCKKYFIPKDDYFQMIVDINTVGQNPERKKTDSSTTFYPSK
jgi:hypothetical protein